MRTVAVCYRRRRDAGIEHVLARTLERVQTFHAFIRALIFRAVLQHASHDADVPSSPGGDESVSVRPDACHARRDVF